MRRSHWAAVVAAVMSVFSLSDRPVFGAEERVVEEIVVTARQKQESLQDVPVTIAALTEADLNRYNISTLTEASKLVPNFQVFHGGSGNGSNIILRGIGSSSISAAFDQSVAINVDGVVVNIGRFIHNAYMDMRQIEVLKGPQSLYFGKSATAGVISVTSNDPGDEFEATGSVGYEPRHERRYLEGVLSGPLTDELGARLAFGYTKSDEMFENLDTRAKHHYRGEDALNVRGTLVWTPTDDLKLRLKASYSTYDNDGANGWTEEICPEGHVQPSAIPAATVAFGLFDGVDDCKINGNTSINDLNPALRAGLPYGADSGIPFLKQRTQFVALKGDYNVADSLALTSVTGFVNLEHKELDIYDYNAGVFGGLHRNYYQSWSQEFRLNSSFDGPLNFQAGGYFQYVKQEFNAFQYAFNLGLIAGPDPVTGNQFDYNKNHFLNSTVWSGYVAGYWDITDDLQLTAGVRYTDESKIGHITIPYLHAAARAFGFGAPAYVGGLEFDDTNWSPEVALNYHITPDVSVYASYKRGFKSGGVDNSALPTNSLDPAQNPDFPNFLIYKSEEAEGPEAGIKADLLDRTLRVDASIFNYTYSDLQVQLFDSATIQFRTFNASELRTRGVETGASWLTPIDGLTLRGTVALTDTEYTKDFINATGENLKGSKGRLSAPFAAMIGGTYDQPFNPVAGWRSSVSLDARFNSGYPYSATLAPFRQDPFWFIDAAVKFYSEDEKYEISLIGKNLLDEFVVQGSGSRPGACPFVNRAALGVNPFAVCARVPANGQDQVATHTLGLEYELQLKVRF